MSSRASLIRELDELREELSSLSLRVERLRDLVANDTEFELVGESSAGAATGSHGDPEHEEAARDTGRFFTRCLEGLPRGDSGRSRVKLQNRIYVVLRTFEGKIHTHPVLVLERYSQVKKLVCNPQADNAFGDSIFCGFPSRWEAQLAVATANCRWP